jgi:RNA polymerase sigma-70 factor (ECF subfamily)
MPYSLRMANPAPPVRGPSEREEGLGTSILDLRRAGLVRVEGVPSLVERSRQGDRDAFAELYRLFRGPIYRVARLHLGGRAEDAVSETFLRAWKSLPRYRPMGAPFGAWLYGIARHVVADQRASARREEARSMLPDRAEDPDTEERITLMGAIERLPKVQRYVIEAKFLVGLSNGEVAAALGKSIGAINTIQWRALRALHLTLGQR